ncbi:reverse transcriptase N-terminal domain-containing protein, partial [Moorena sp. SIO3I6]|uniref:reverse transcriptase N-terminal domain-containing protein n=1 Tax=Moorena sp. SIO3I6 TaxID=2607831 RepID=UPI0013F8C6EA
MVRRHDRKEASELWKSQNWKKLRKDLFRLQRRVFKAVREGDIGKAKSLQKLIMKSRAAQMLAVRQITQLNQGKKTAGIDGVKSMDYYERVKLVKRLQKEGNNWMHSGLREIPIPKKNGKTRILKVP